MIVPKIVFEDPQILVIDKPSGLVVNRAESVREETVQDWTEKKFAIRNSQFEITSDFVRRAGIVHRLDKEASGLLVIAKTLLAFENLKAQFKERQVKKKYLALVHGKIESSEGEIILPIKRLPWDRKKFGIIPGGKKSRTKFKVVANYQLSRYSTQSVDIENPRHKVSGLITNYTLLEASPITGRTHQIRVHFKHLGHPLVGDLKYSGRRVKKDQKFCPRLFLHAIYICFVHPQTNKKIEFKSLLPQDLEKTLQGLNKAE